MVLHCPRERLHRLLVAVLSGNALEVALLKLMSMHGAWSRRGTEEGVAGAGIVLRDEWGWFIAARNAFHQHGHYGVSVKCRGWSLACSRGDLEFAKYLGMRKVVIEGDSQQVVVILKLEMESPAVLEVIVEDVRRMARQFEECVVQFVRRSANVVADKLARCGVRGSSPKTWEARPFLLVIKPFEAR